MTALGLLVLALVVPAVAEDVNVTGAWRMTSQTPRGERVSDISMVQEGTKLTVTSKDRDGNEVKSEGTITGADITWTMRRVSERGEWVITYRGKIDGATMSGTMEFGQADRTGTWKAERVKS
jgi:hypothetical protein